MMKTSAGDVSSQGNYQKVPFEGECERERYMKNKGEENLTLKYFASLTMAIAFCCHCRRSHDQLPIVYCSLIPLPQLSSTLQRLLLFSLRPSDSATCAPKGKVEVIPRVY